MTQLADPNAQDTAWSGPFCVERHLAHDADDQARAIAGWTQEYDQLTPGRFEGADDVLGAMMNMDLFARPDNYYETLPPRYRSLTAATLDQAARATIDPKGFTWVVVGDAANIRPQLDKLGIPIEVVEAP